MSLLPSSPSGVPDRVTVSEEGVRVRALPTGVSTRKAVLHTDDRGSLCEIFDLRWGWHAEPVVATYFITLRPVR